MKSAFNSSVFDRVALAVEKTVHAKTPDLSHSTHLTDDLALGRLGRLKLAIALEEVFDVELEDEVVERFGNIGDIVSHFSDRYFRDIDESALAEAA